MNKESLIKWMTSNNLDSEWLADKCGVKLPTVNSWRSNRPIPAKAVFIIKTLMDNLNKKEPNNLIIMKPSHADYQAWNRKALGAGMTVEDWAFDGLNSMAEEATKKHKVTS